MIINSIFRIEAGSEYKPEMDPRRIERPGLQIVPTESPEIRERRERDDAVLRKGILERIERGENIWEWDRKKETPLPN